MVQAESHLGHLQQSNHDTQRHRNYGPLARINHGPPAYLQRQRLIPYITEIVRKAVCCSLVMIAQRYRLSPFTSSLRPKYNYGRRAPLTASERFQPAREATK